jgi:hypothetical protein
MNRKSVIATAVLAAAGASAFAIEGEQFVPDAASRQQTSTLSREEVKNELRELQSAGWQPMQEASPTPLQAAEMDRKIAQLPSQQRLAQANAADDVRQSQSGSEDQQIALVDSTDGSIMIIEAAPIEESQVPDNSSLPFEHPAVSDDPAR